MTDTLAKQGEPASDGSQLPVLMYHRIADSGSAESAQWRVSPRRFALQLEWLQSNGYESVSLLDVDRFLAGEPLPQARPVLLTFDDGYQDFADEAAPLLAKYEFSAALFVVVDHVGGTSSWDRHIDNDVALLSWEQLGELARSGIAIESHCRTHVHMPQKSEGVVAHELASSRTAIGEATGVLPLSVAYPFGANTPEIQWAASRAGYQMGFGTVEGFVTRTSPRFALPRIEVHEAWFPDQVLGHPLSGSTS